MPRIVSVSSLKGGVGKTSLVLGLASAALHGGLKTLVIDLDPHADASTGLQVDGTTPDIASLLVGRSEHVFLTSVAASGWNRMAGTPTLLNSKPAADGQIQVARGSARSILLDTRDPSIYIERIQNLIRATQAAYDLVLIDCPPFMGTLTSVGWAASQRVLAVAEPSLFSVAGTERTLRGIIRFQYESGHRIDGVAVIINKMHPGNPEHLYRREELRELFGDLVAEPTLNECHTVQRAQGAAFPLHYWTDEEVVDPATRFTRLLTGVMASI